MTIISLERTADTLPADFPALEVDARDDGHAHMTRLAAEFATDRAMFHAIFTCHLDGRLAGIGAITDEPAPAPVPMWRMRRFYVHRDCRRRKVARAIANALLQEAAGKVAAVTVHAGNADAVRFWEAMRFTGVDGQPWSHQAHLPILGPSPRS
ncbi:GNAT family N-acetyltransferase [Bradyrhizobium yuanmingense]|uniref:GNAT family N-acetyltransferase n=1 Tax=Bradyrhizobium yuanmingense TaxID=108015 RepID=UPI0023B89CFB|nr:GNAT family N-acetyltransferase [Bradyrhizobium yuanmingense]MDF0521270.1 GNAT family N-acetyltransferase [Bradyrhizobium yuanmingense]